METKPQILDKPTSKDYLKKEKKYNVLEGFFLCSLPNIFGFDD